MAIDQVNIWHPFEFLAGDWKGTGSGEPGVGEYERSYRFIFNRRFLEVKNKPAYPPTEKNPQGEIHQDIGYLSYDKTRLKFIYRQFHVEGFVNQYILESISDDERNFVFVSEAIENIPAGWQARESYRVTSENEFTETFELAPPGGEFSVYSSVTLRK